MTGLVNKPQEFELVASMVGHTIVAATLHPEHEGLVSIGLDDGRVIDIVGWGHDWWGVQVDGPLEARPETPGDGER